MKTFNQDSALTFLYENYEKWNAEFFENSRVPSKEEAIGHCDRIIATLTVDRELITPRQSLARELSQRSTNASSTPEGNPARRYRMNDIDAMIQDLKRDI